MTAKNPSEPIAELLARSSLGTRQVTILAAGAPGAAVRHILRQVARSFDHPARTSGLTRIYSSSETRRPPSGAREE